MATQPGRPPFISSVRVWPVAARVRAAVLLLFVLAGTSALPVGDARAQTQSQPARTSVGPAASLLPTQAEKERFHRLAEELRCLVCQNQTLADSDAELAADLRREVEQLMLDGRSDAQIKAWLVDRYGDFVLYRPPMQRNTWFLWLGPFALLAAGGLLWWRVLARHRNRTAGYPADPGPDPARSAGNSATGSISPPIDGTDTATARAQQLLKDS